MVKKRGRPPEKRGRGRPKGSKNKIVNPAKLHEYWSKEFGKDNAKIGSTLRIRMPSDFKIEDKNKLALSSRLDECMTRLENAVAEAITKLKEMI